jgi:hypothetical protein
MIGLSDSTEQEQRMPQSLSLRNQTHKRTRPRARPALKSLLQSALRGKFPSDTVDISDGFDGNIHVLVVSRVFDKMSERSRRAYLWNVIESTDMTDAELELITVLLAISPRELK